MIHDSKAFDIFWSSIEREGRDRRESKRYIIVSEITETQRRRRLVPGMIDVSFIFNPTTLRRRGRRCWRLNA